MMASPPPAETPATSINLFRPSKKRKIYRQRSPSPSSSRREDASLSAHQSLDELITSSYTAAQTQELSPKEIESFEDSNIPISEILRLRKLRKPKAGGVEFRAKSVLARDDEDAAHGVLVVTDKQQDENASVSIGYGQMRRFAPQTGTVLDVNKHMATYVDSELARRRLEGLRKESQNPDSTAGSSTTSSQQLGSRDLEMHKQPATLGKLLEIDLGDEVRSKNVEMTEKARRKMDGEDIEEAETGTSGKRVRLGPDGKPWRGRKRRRGSDDVKRDKLVEDILRENKLEVYEQPVIESQTVNDDQAADDRIAEAFRKDFMDAVSQKHRKKNASTQQANNRTGATKKEEEVLKGPRLGGSRSARAAMRETLLKAQKK